MLYAWAVVWLLVGASACATLPAHRAQRALYIDTQKAIRGEERVGWTVDRVEIAEAAAQAEPSACRVPESDRKALRAWVQARIDAEGGPAKQQFERGVDYDDLDHVVDLERVAAVLDHIEQHVPEDCPFWVKPNPKFRGLHSTARRFVPIAESMGSGALLYSRGSLQAAGGAAARLLLSYGFPVRMQFAAGLEGGGDAILQRGSKKGDGLTPAGVIRFAAPALIRWNDLDRIYDLELAGLVNLEQGKFAPWGGRVAFAAGVSGLRRLGFMPAVQVWVGYELFPTQDGFKAQHGLRLGTRIGLDYARMK